MITAERIAYLKEKGYVVEDMAHVWGKKFQGEFRWMNDTTGEFQDGTTSYRPEVAWASASERQDEIEAQENAVIQAWVDAFMSESETV